MEAPRKLACHDLCNFFISALPEQRKIVPLAKSVKGEKTV